MPIGKGGEHLPYKGEPGYEEAKAADPDAYANEEGSRPSGRPDTGEGPADWSAYVPPEYTQHPTGKYGGPPLTYPQARAVIQKEFGVEEPREEQVLDLMRFTYRVTPPSTEELLRGKMANETGRLAGVEFQEVEDTGRPREVSIDERKRVGAEVTRVARELGVGGKFTAPAGLDQEGLVRWQEAAVADMRKQTMSPEELIRDMKKAEQTSYRG